MSKRSRNLSSVKELYVVLFFRDHLRVVFWYTNMQRGEMYFLQENFKLVLELIRYMHDQILYSTNCWIIPR